MRSKKFTCEICGAVAEIASDDWFAGSHPRDWFYVVVARRKGWHSQMDPVPAGPTLSYPRSFPWRWHENVTPPQDVHLDFCSADCAFQGMRKLHEGARIVSFDGPDPLTAQEVSYVLNFRKNADVATA